VLSISPFAFTTESLRRPGGVSVLASSRQFDIGGPVCVNMCDDVVSVCVHVCVCVCVCPCVCVYVCEKEGDISRNSTTEMYAYRWPASRAVTEPPRRKKRSGFAQR